MVKYVSQYDEIYDETFQVEIDDETAARISASGGPASTRIYNTPLPNLPLKSRHRSERHPEGEWDKYSSREEYNEAHKNGPCGPDCPLNSASSTVTDT